MPLMPASQNPLRRSVSGRIYLQRPGYLAAFDLVEPAATKPPAGFAGRRPGCAIGRPPSLGVFDIPPATAGPSPVMARARPAPGSATGATISAAGVRAGPCPPSGDRFLNYDFPCWRSAAADLIPALRQAMLMYGPPLGPTSLQQAELTGTFQR